MKVNVYRHACDLVPLLGELHAPRQGGWLTPATARSEAALAPEEIADGDARCTGVGSFPPRQFIVLHQEVTCAHGSEQPSIPDAAGTQKIERQEQRRIVSVFRLGEEHQDLRTDKPSEQHPQTKVVDLLMRQTIALRELNCDQNRAEKCDSEKDA